MSEQQQNVLSITNNGCLEHQAYFGELSLLEFIGFAWDMVEPATPFIPGPHLDLICDHLEAITYGQIRNLLINIPPRHMKSLAVCVFWPVWEWIAKPSRRWLFASYAQSLSTRDSLRCRRLIESTWFQQCFGDRFHLAGDQNTKDRFENDKGGCRIATSTGGAATGEGGDRIVVDDPHNVIDAPSDAARNAALEWWDQTMSTRLNDPKTGAKVIVMQRIHENDLSGHVLKQGGYEHLCLPAEFEPARKCITSIGSDWRKHEGELLWPARIGQSEISNFKSVLGPMGYAGQFQQRPTPAGGAMFQKEWFRYYEPRDNANVGCALAHAESLNSTEESTSGPPLSPLPVLRGRVRVGVSADDATLLEPPPRPSAGVPGEGEKSGASEIFTRFAAMDPAGTEPSPDNDPCYTVIQVWDVTKSWDMLLVYQYRKQVQAPDAADAAVSIVRDFECEYIVIERDGLGLGVVQHVRRRGVTVRSVKARGSKEARAQAVQIRMSNGQIYFPHDASFLFDLEHELLHFPKSRYNDQVDAMAHAASMVQRLAGSSGSEKEEPTTETRRHGGALDEWEPFENG